MKNKTVFFFLLLLFSIGSLISSAQVNDAGMWLSLNAEKKITPALSFNLSEEFRFNENLLELGSFFTDAGVSYKISKMFRISANYRFSNKRRIDDSYSKRHRYYVDLVIRKNFNPLVFSFRTRYQSQYSDMFSSSDGLISSSYIREKLQIKFDLNKKYSPYVYSELYYSLNNPKGNRIDNMRYAAGIEYSINRMHSIDLFYLIQNEMNVKSPVRDFVIGLGYNFTF